MAYEVHFVIGGYEAKVIEEIHTKEAANDVAASLEERGCPAEVVDTTEL